MARAAPAAVTDGAAGLVVVEVVVVVVAGTAAVGGGGGGGGMVGLNEKKQGERGGGERGGVARVTARPRHGAPASAATAAGRFRSDATGQTSGQEAAQRPSALPQ